MYDEEEFAKLKIVLQVDEDRNHVVLSVESEEEIEPDVYLKCITEFIEDCYKDGPEKLFVPSMADMPFENMQ